jgi:hypothetical protein
MIEKFKYFLNLLKKHNRYLMIKSKLINVFFSWVYFGAWLFEKITMVFILLAENSSYICYLFRKVIFKILYSFFSFFPLNYNIRLVKVEESIFLKKKKEKKEKKALLIFRLTGIFNKLFYIMDSVYKKLLYCSIMPSIEINYTYTYGFINVYYLGAKLVSCIVKLLEYIDIPKLDLSLLDLKVIKKKGGYRLIEIDRKCTELFNRSRMLSRIKLFHSKYSYYSAGWSREATIVLNWLEKNLFNFLYSFFGHKLSFQLKLVFGTGPQMRFRRPLAKISYVKGEVLAFHFDFELVFDRYYILLKINGMLNYLKSHINKGIKKMNKKNERVCFFFRRKRNLLIKKLKLSFDLLREKGDKKEEGKKRKNAKKKEKESANAKKKEKESANAKKKEKENEKLKNIMKFSFLDYFLFRNSEDLGPLDFKKKTKFFPYKLIAEKKTHKSSMSFEDFEVFVEKTFIWSIWCSFKTICYELADIFARILQNKRFFAFWQYIFSTAGVISVIFVFFIELLWLLIGKSVKLLFAIFFLFYLLVAYLIKIVKRK